MGNDDNDQGARARRDARDAAEAALVGAGGMEGAARDAGRAAGTIGFPITSNGNDAATAPAMWAAWRAGWLIGTARRIEELPQAEQVAAALRAGYIAHTQHMLSDERPPFAALAHTSAWDAGWQQAEMGLPEPPAHAQAAPAHAQAAPAAASEAASEAPGEGEGGKLSADEQRRADGGGIGRLW